MTDRPLHDVRVIDLADQKGELAGRLLADLGADVIRVEPSEGAASRCEPPFHEGDSLYFAYRNFNKRGMTFDAERVAELALRADVLIESFGPGGLLERGIDADALRAANPSLVVLNISDFGAWGPYRDWVATDATLEALGGMQFQAGIPEKQPLLPPGTLAYDIAGILGAFAALSALVQRQRTGHGQTLDLSILEALAQQTNWAMANATFQAAKGLNVVEQRVGSGPMYKIYPCKTGYVRLVILSPRQWHAMREWLGEPEYLQDAMYDSMLGRLQIMDALEVLIGDLFVTMPHQELAAECQRRGIVCTPVLNPDEVLINEHFVSRDTFPNVEYKAGATGPVQAGFLQIDGERQGYRGRAPGIGEHDDEIAQGIWAEERPAPSGPAPEPSAPFAGLRVLDFGIGGVGVEASRLLAVYGADVIKIESRSAPDFIRVVMSTEMSASFASSSTSKRGFGVNLKEAKGLELLHKLVEQADIVIENSSTGAMDKMGVGYEALCKINPRIVMASGQLLGAHGAWSDWIGYGPNTQPVGGLVYLWNYDDQDDPAGSTSIFPDHLAGRVAALGALAMLYRRESTGLGGHAQLAQVETVTGIIGDLLLKAGLEPGSVQPKGNRSERGAPWGSYRCAGNEQWVAITIRDDMDWKKLCGAMGAPEWTTKPEYETVEGRRNDHDEIDARLSEWTAVQTKKGVTSSLQMFGVPALPMLTGAEMSTDPHLCARGYPRWINQQDLGWIAYEGPCFKATGMLDANVYQAPKVGEHTRVIAAELLGLGEAEIEALVADGVLEVAKDG